MGQEKIDALIDKKRREQTPFYQKFPSKLCTSFIELSFQPFLHKKGLLCMLHIS
jgi:hypothetical protein